MLSDKALINFEKWYKSKRRYLEYWEFLNLEIELQFGFHQLFFDKNEIYTSILFDFKDGIEVFETDINGFKGAWNSRKSAIAHVIQYANETLNQL